MSAPSPIPTTSAPARALVRLVRVYQRRLSPLKGTPSCRFTPTCSEYAAQAIAVHGAARGSALALARLLRCHPLHPGGYDPVPPPTPQSTPTSTRPKVPHEKSV